jgi:hypothetical protein
MVILLLNQFWLVAAVLVALQQELLELLVAEAVLVAVAAGQVKILHLAEIKAVMAQYLFGLGKNLY